MSRYDITKELLNKFEKTIADFNMDEVIKSGLHPVLAKACLDALESKRQDLAEELKQLSEDEPLHK